MVADALGVRRHRVTLVSGQSNRAKVAYIDGDHTELVRRVETLRAAR